MKSLYSHPCERALISAFSRVSQENPNLVLSLASKHKLAADHFHLPAHQHLFERILDLARNGTASTTETLSAGKEWEGLGVVAGADVSAILEVDGGGVFAIPGLVRILKDLALRRRAAGIAERFTQAITPPSPFSPAECFSFSRELIQLISSEPGYREHIDVYDALKPKTLDIEPGKSDLCIPTGIKVLDRVIAGWQRGVLNVIAAATGVGKSALLATTIDAMARNGVRVGVFSLEDKAEWVAFRILAKHSSLSQQAIKYKPKSEIERSALLEAYGVAERSGRNIIHDDRTGLTSKQIAASAQTLIQDYGCQIIVVDHIGEMRVDDHGRERHDLNIAAAMADLRDIGKNHSLPIVVAGQLKAGADPDRPQKTDIANSYEIARMARVILTLARKSGTEAMLTVVKQTEGPADIAIPLEFIPHAGMFRST